jgi:hypothetical protein
MGMLRYVFPILVGLVFFLVIGVVTAAAFALGQPPRDPFSPYASILPGKALTSLREYDCQLSSFYPEMSGPHFYCQVEPDNDEAVLSIMITGHNRQISGLWFHTHGVEMADLVKRWGRPTSIKAIGGMYLVWWGKSVYAVVHTPGWLTYQSSVRYVSLYDYGTG